MKFKTLAIFGILLAGGAYVYYTYRKSYNAPAPVINVNGMGDGVTFAVREETNI